MLISKKIIQPFFGRADVLRSGCLPFFLPKSQEKRGFSGNNYNFIIVSKKIIVKIIVKKGNTDMYNIYIINIIILLYIFT